MKPYLNAGRNVTTDSFFTSVNFAEILKKKKISLFEGTMQKIRKEILREVQNSKSPLYATGLLKHGDFTFFVHGKGSQKCAATKYIA